MARKKVKKKRKDQGSQNAGSAQSVNAQDEAVEEVVEVKTESPLYRLSRKSCKVIIPLWSYEIVFVVAEIGKAAFLRRYSEGPEKLTADLAPKSFSSAMLLIGTIVWMTAIAVKTSGKFKMWMLFIGLMVYFAASFAGILASSITLNIFAGIMIWLQISWHAVNPIRFWLIFNQQYPIPASTARKVVTANVFLIGVAEYIVSVFPLPENFVHAYTIFWFVVWLVVGVWWYSIFRVRSEYNEIEDDPEKIAEKYIDAEVEECFRAKQTAWHTAIFSLLLGPSIMFPIMKSAITQIVVSSPPSDLSHIATYRIDLAVSLGSLLVFFFLLIFKGCVRNEMKNVLSITLAHFLNFFVLAFLLFSMLVHANRSLSATPTNPQLRETQIPANHTLAFYYPDSAYKDTVFLVGHEVLKHGRSAISREDLYLEASGEEDTKKLVRAITRNGRELFSFEHDFKEAYASWFLHKGKLYRITNEGVALPKNESERIAWAISGFEHCGNGSSRDESGNTRFMYRGACHSLSATVTFEDAENGSAIGKPVQIDVPPVGESATKSIRYPSTGVFHKTEIFIDGEKIDEFRRNTATNESQDLEGRSDLEIIFWLDSSDEQFRAVPIHVDRSSRMPLRKQTEPLDSGTSGSTGDLVSLSNATAPMDAASAEGTGRVDRENTTDVSDFRMNTTLWIVTLVLSGAANGIASGCYIHFIWIQSPWTGRAIILAAYFAINYSGGWYVRNYVSGYEGSQELLACQMVALFWHVIAMSAFYVNLPELTADEKRLGEKRLF